MSPIEDHVLATLRGVSTATIQSQLFKRGLRNVFLNGVRPMSAVASFAGEAYTLRHVPAREDLDTLAVFEDPEHPQRKAIETMPAGQVLIMDCHADIRAASGGSILMTRLSRRGVAAMVTDAAIRDSPAIAGLDFPVYAAGSSANLNLVAHHAVESQVPIGCAGVPVYPGDVVVGDGEGVVAIPRHLAEEVAQAAAEQEQLEEFILARIQDGQPLRGNYPPSAETAAAFRQQRR